MSRKEQILESALHQFMQFGIKSQTMDDIARTQGISKKTLYEVVKDKADLVMKSMEHHMKLEMNFVKKNFKKNTNAIKELFMICDFLGDHIKEMNPTVMYDLQKYYPETWRLFNDHKNEFLYNMIYNNIQKGRDQKIYATDFDASAIAKIYISRIDSIIDSRLFPPLEYTFRGLIAEMRKYHIRGIASAKGLKVLEQQLKLAS